MLGKAGCAWLWVTPTGLAGGNLPSSKGLRLEGAEEQHSVRVEPRPGDIIADKYKVEALIGSGSMGSVFAARNLGTGKRVALKWLLSERATDNEHIARFHREARMAGRIDHPNVVTIYDVGRHGPSTFLVMELLNGQPLRELMNHGPLPVVEAIQILMPALRGIAAAHAEGVIHRDLKPDNIFLCKAPDGTPRESKVLDFGISKLADEIREGLSVTQTGTVIGTPYYLSPEQVRGVRDIDHRIDVYAMGVILYEMLARRPPFVADTYSGLVIEIATGQPTPLRALRPDVSEELTAVISKALHRDRDKRFEDIASFARALEPFAAGIPFRPSRGPDWTNRFEVQSPSTPAPMSSTMAETKPSLVPADTTTRSVVQRPSSEVEPEADPEPAPQTAPWSESSRSAAEEPETAASARPRWPVLLGVGLGLLLVAIVVTIVASSGPDEVRAEDPPVQVTPAPSDVSGSDEEVAAEQEPQVEPRVEQAPEEPPTTEAADPTPPPTMRTARPRMRVTEPAMRQTTMMRHRAGDISLEDF